jgi:purine-nucleoside phosphorylase
MTPQIEADKGAYADIVLLPGDPLRAEWIAETFLDEFGCVNRVRNMFGFTGSYKGRRVSVQATGMGQPSAAIYATELLKFYGVKTLLRVGTCGALAEDIQLRDIILAASASTDSNINQIVFEGADFAPVADPDLLREASQLAESRDLPFHVGGILSSDIFYGPDGYLDKWTAHGTLAVEMETSILYTLAARYGARSLTILTVSDHIPRGESISPGDRQSALESMARLALDLAVDVQSPETSSGILV